MTVEQLVAEILTVLRRRIPDAAKVGQIAAILDDYPAPELAARDRWSGLMAGFAPAPTDRSSTGTFDHGGPTGVEADA